MPKFLNALNITGLSTMNNQGATTGLIFVGAPSNIGIGSGVINSGSTPGSDNIAIGHLSMFSNNSGIGTNVAVGAAAMQLGADLASCVAVGYKALNACNVTGSVGIGYQAGKAATTAIGTFIGYNAGLAVTTGGNNTIVGYGAGPAVTTGTGNTLVGHQAGASVTVSNATVLGYAANAAASGGVAIGVDSSGTGAFSNGTNHFQFGTTNHLYNFPGKVNSALTFVDFVGDHITWYTGYKTGMASNVLYTDVAVSAKHEFRVNAVPKLSITSTALNFVEGVDVLFGTTTGTKIGTLATQKLGFWNATPVVQNAGWAMSGYTADKILNAGSTTLNELAAVVATLVDTLKTYGLLGA